MYSQNEKLYKQVKVEYPLTVNQAFPNSKYKKENDIDKGGEKWVPGELLHKQCPFGSKSLYYALIMKEYPDEVCRLKDV